MFYYKVVYFVFRIIYITIFTRLLLNLFVSVSSFFLSDPKRPNWDKSFEFIIKFMCNRIDFFKKSSFIFHFLFLIKHLIHFKNQNIISNIV